MELIAAGRFECRAGEANNYVEHLRVDALSVGTYSIPAGGVDDQRPHTEDEVYAVVSGRGRFTGGDQTVPVGAGSVLFVPAGERHRFHDVAEDLAVLVLFAPPYGSGAPALPNPAG